MAKESAQKGYLYVSHIRHFLKIGNTAIVLQGKIYVRVSPDIMHLLPYKQVFRLTHLCQAVRTCTGRGWKIQTSPILTILGIYALNQFVRPISHYKP